MRDQQVFMPSGVNGREPALGFEIDFPADWPLERCEAVTAAAHEADRRWRSQKESA